MTTLPNGDELPPSPSADDVQTLIRAQNIRAGVAIIVILLLVGYTAWLAGGGRSAAIDSGNATKASLATNARNVCITERRNLQSEALGDMLRHGLNAQIAGLVQPRDPARAIEEVAATEEATQRWQAATESLQPEALDAPVKDGGCGRPVLTVDDIGQGTD